MAFISLRGGRYQCGRAKSNMLADGKHVAIGIFEPRHLVSCWRGPNPELLILYEGIFFKHHAAAGEPRHHHFNILDFPAEDGIGSGSEIFSLGDSDRGLAGSDDQANGSSLTN